MIIENFLECFGNELLAIVQLIRLEFFQFLQIVMYNFQCIQRYLPRDTFNVTHKIPSTTHPCGSHGSTYVEIQYF